MDGCISIGTLHPSASVWPDGAFASPDVDYISHNAAWQEYPDLASLTLERWHGDNWDSILENVGHVRLDEVHIYGMYATMAYKFRGRHIFKCETKVNCWSSCC
ncbi:hypothetical protein GDO78_018713 [Eleutherodactylus coqui]|uniref:Uncharacterized protein n=1 Tax=Eleutherodactylus coqui TaxID=57060 RepID=A0A8J6EIX1_ELECQ|nr:hypothetical protein GDO78_018713 [Eleutherodactylus coqui]